MTYPVKDIAKWFINEMHPEPLKLQKLLYFSQGISYAFYDKPLFEEELEAWVHGPVVSSVYHLYKNFQYNPIDIEYELPKFDQEVLDILEYVKKNYGQYSSKYLEEMTHQQEPWLISRSGLDPDERTDKTIPKSDIANYFISEIFQPDEGEWYL